MAEKRIILLILLLIPFFIFMTAEHEEHSSHLKDFLGKTLNFLILFGGLAFILRKPLRNFLEKRSKEIENSLEEAENAKKEAELKLKEADSRLAGLNDEIEKIKKESEIDGRGRKKEITQFTHQEAEKMRNFAKQEIEMLVLTGIQELKEHTAELAISLAEERIRKRLTSEDMAILIDKSIVRLDKIHENSNSSKKIHSRAS